MSNIAAFQKRIAGIHHQRIAWSARDFERIAAYYGVDPRSASLPAAPAQHRAHELVSISKSADGITAHFIASDASVDRMGDTIAVNGWHLAAFKKNPVILWVHDSGSLPVGKAVSVGVQGDKLMIGVRFASTGLGKTVAGMVSAGYLKAVSVGFAPIEYEFAKGGGRAGGIDFKQQELLEVSIVPVPANAAALLTGITGSDGKALPKPKAKAARLRDLEIIKLRLPPETAKQRRSREVAALRGRG
jgi:HK97 family phage prohead protease